MRAEGFVKRWERQRTMGRMRYAALHAVGFPMLLLGLALGVRAITGEAPGGVTPLTVAIFTVGGFAYGLIRFNMRERFYQMAKQDDLT